MVKKSLSIADPGQVLKSVHTYRDSALRVLITNGDIPVEFTSRDFTYTTINSCIVVSEIDYFIGGQREVTSVNAVADVAGSLGGLYFFISSPTVDYYVWFDVDNGSIDPAPASRTGIEVDISAGDDRNTVAAAIKTALDTNGSFLTVVNTQHLIITNKALGNVTDFSSETSTMLGGVITQGANRILKASKLFTYDATPNVTNEEIIYQTVDEF